MFLMQPIKAAILTGALWSSIAAQSTPTAQPSTALADLAGRWRASLRAEDGVKVPLTLSIERGETTSNYQAWIINGPERLPVAFESGQKTFHLSFPHYDSRIECELVRVDQLALIRGVWTKRRLRGTSDIPFSAIRMPPPIESTLPTIPGLDEPRRDPNHLQLSGRWRVQFEHDPHPAVGIFEEQRNGTVHGTFLTALGDYRYLAGERVGNDVVLSCFDGAHAFRFDMELRASTEDGKPHRLAGAFASLPTWRETFTAVPDPKAQLADAWSMTSVTEGQVPLSATFPLATGAGEATLDDPRFTGDGRIIVVFGTWCPNCRDATSFLAELDRQYRDRGLRIVGLACEHDRPLGENRRRVRAYAESAGAEYPILIAGLSDKSAAGESLPWLDKVRAYPTFIFADRNGKVIRTYTGFSGPATGKAHERLRDAFDGTVRSILESNRRLR